MLKLEIKKVDDSVYWVEYFNIQADVDKWIAEEQTRPYWDKSFTYTIVDISDKTPAETQADNEAVKQELENMRASIRTARGTLNTMTVAQLRGIIALMLDYLGLR
jgi:ribosomal protein L29